MATSDVDKNADHPLWAQLESLQTTVNNLAESVKSGDVAAISAHADDILALQHTVTHVRRELDRVSPTLIRTQKLDDINSITVALLQQLNLYVRRPDRTDLLASAWSHADTLLQRLTVLPRFHTAEDVGDLREAASNYRRVVGQYRQRSTAELDELRAEAQRARAKIHELNQEIEGEQGRLKALVDQFEGRQDDLISRLDEQSQQSLATLNNDTQTNLRDFQQRMLEAQEKRITEHHDRFTEFFDDIKANTEARDKQLTIKSDELMRSLEGKFEEAKDIVGLVGIVGMTGNYRKSSESEQKSADQWRYIGFALGILGAGVAIFMFTSDPPEWGVLEIIRRTILSIVLFGVASYALQQSASHREQQRLHRRMELELTSLLPYLAQLPDPQAQRLKVALAPRYFPGHSLSSDNQEVHLPKIDPPEATPQDEKS